MSETAYALIAGAMRYVFVLLIWLVLLITADRAIREYRSERRQLGRRVVIGYLEKKNADGEPERFPLGVDALIGSGRGCDVRLTDSGVRNRHAQVLFRDEGIFLLDLTEGEAPIRINGVEAPERVQLLNQDRLTIGSVTLRLHLGVMVDE